MHQHGNPSLRSAEPRLQSSKYKVQSSNNVVWQSHTQKLNSKKKHRQDAGAFL